MTTNAPFEDILSGKRASILIPMSTTGLPANENTKENRGEPIPPRTNQNGEN